MGLLESDAPVRLELRMTVSVLVLIVEDEVLIQSALAEALEEGGFQTINASNGKDAIEILDQKKADIRALLTDVNLGRKEITGWNVAKRARELIPAIPVVYMTGGNSYEWDANGVPNSILLAKPFTSAQAVTAISQLLNAHPAP